MSEPCKSESQKSMLEHRHSVVLFSMKGSCENAKMLKKPG